MACETNLITSGMDLTCINNVGGIKNIYITDAVNVEGVTEASKVVSAITMTVGTQFWQFVPTRNGAGMEETSTPNLDTGSTFYTQTLTMNIPYRDATRSITVEELMEGQKDLSIIIQDQNGIYWLLGKEEFNKVTELGGGTGTAKDELNGYAITTVAEEASLAPTVDAAIIPALLIPAV